MGQSTTKNPNRNNYKRLNISIPTEEHRLIKTKAFQEGLSIKKFILDAIEDKLQIKTPSKSRDVDEVFELLKKLKGNKKIKPVSVEEMNKNLKNYFKEKNQ